jgi:hypothetical protein
MNDIVVNSKGTKQISPSLGINSSTFLYGMGLPLLHIFSAIFLMTYEMSLKIPEISQYTEVISCSEEAVTLHYSD